MYSRYELLYLIKILDYHESGLVRIIEYYIKTYTFKIKKELQNAINKWDDINLKLNCELKYGHINYWNRSKIPNGYDLKPEIHLKFWFNNNTGLTLPLVSLPFQNNKININFHTDFDI